MKPWIVILVLGLAFFGWLFLAVHNSDKARKLRAFGLPSVRKFAEHASGENLEHPMDTYHVPYTGGVVGMSRSDADGRARQLAG